MQDEKDFQMKKDIIAQIEAVESYYSTIKTYLSGREYDPVEIMATVEVFKEALNRISGHILTLYVLNKQKTKITWQPLLENLENATSTTSTLQGNATRNPRSAIELAFNISQPNAQEVMAYLAKLKESLK